MLLYSRIMVDEREITLDKIAGAEPKIEPDESLEGEPAKEPDENTVSEGKHGEAGCPIRMGLFNDARRCMRKLHVAPDGVDERPVCLMHSKDLRKQSGSLFDDFWHKFDRILKVAGGGAAHFERFVFPEFDFSNREFQAICSFAGAIFTQDAMFWKATFTQKADFEGAFFSQLAYFPSATFTQDANFGYATFMRDADFSCATFKRNANFLRANFTQDADFCDATFTQGAEFFKATFTQLADFFKTKFYRKANWQYSRFLAQAAFRRTKFEPLVEGMPSAVFDGANFANPDEIVFDDVDLSRVLFHNCDVSQVSFTSSVRWAKREGNRGLAVFEEWLLLDQQLKKELMEYGPLDCPAVAQIYQQLKKNYDFRLDYWTANEFHYGEMEMKRLAGPMAGPLLWLQQWLHRRLSFVALYRLASDYGNSYRKPMLWLFATLVLFSALLPLPGVGLKRQGVMQAETYASVWRTGDGWTPNLWTEARLVGKSAITSADTAIFQKSAEYAPAYPWGRVLAIFETVLTSSLLALFLLAIRRQFKR
jgi:hypothetical protein